MKITGFINLHAYFIRLNPPLSEPAKEILREIEEHVLSVIQKERSPIQTQTQTQLENIPGIRPYRTHNEPKPGSIQYREDL